MVDLGGDKPACYAPWATAGGRWLETTELRKSLIARIALLEQDGRWPSCSWATMSPSRRPASCCSGPCSAGAAAAPRELRHRPAAKRRSSPASRACITSCRGQETRPRATRVTLRREREAIGTFGERSHGDAAGHDDNCARKLGSRGRLEAARRNPRAACASSDRLKEGVRIGGGQLIAVKVRSAEHFTLGNVRWALREGGDALMAGIQLFPGELRLVAMFERERATWRPPGGLRSCRRCPPSSRRKPPAAARWQLPHRPAVEIVVGENRRVVKPSRVLDRGSEFERCEFHD